MHLTESQLDAAARKLCELWGLDGDVNVAVLDGAKRKVESVFRVNNNTIAAIIHAVTSETRACKWEHNPEFDRWETECEDLFCLVNHESPIGYGVKWCPFCGRNVVFVGSTQQKDEVSE